MNNPRGVILLSAGALVFFAAGCTKKPVAQTPPPAPAAAAPAEQRRQQAAAPAPERPQPQQTAQVSQPARMPTEAQKKRIEELLARIEDAYFDYNQHSLRPDAIKALQSDSTELRDIIVQYPDYHLTIEGHADERGSEEYNLALGDARAKAAKGYLVQVGIPDAQLHVVSYGKDKPVCEDHDEACWQKNRRIHIVAAAAQ
jgi:peptidoglycan-associated lipoprotein